MKVKVNELKCQFTQIFTHRVNSNYNQGKVIFLLQEY